MALSINDEIARQLYSKVFSPRRQQFEEIPRPVYLLQLLTVEDIVELNKICTSKRLSAKPKEKFAMINEIMVRRGFKKLAAGTNRIAFKYMEDQSFVIKVAFAKTALSDNFRELHNQQLLKPFVTKVFEVSPCGTVGLFERVNPISNREQFMSIAQDVYDIIINHLLGKYVIDDIGSKYFMNWGVRAGSFPVLLDFPYVFELDGSKLYCNCPDPISKFGFCGGDIDYDDGFNFLVCQKCGKKYLASDLRLNGNKSKTPSIIVDRKGDVNMKIQIISTETNKVIATNNTEKETAVYETTKSGKPQGFGLAKREERRKPHIKLAIEKVSQDEEAPAPIEVPRQTQTLAAFNNPGIKPVTKYKNVIVETPDTPDLGFSDKIIIEERIETVQEDNAMLSKDTDTTFDNESLTSTGTGESEDPVTSQEAWNEIYNGETDLDATEEESVEEAQGIEETVDGEPEPEEESVEETEPETQHKDSTGETPISNDKLAAARRLVKFESNDLGEDY